MGIRNSQKKILSWVFISILSFVCITKTVHTHSDYFEQETNHTHSHEDTNENFSNEDCGICSFSLTANEPLTPATEEVFRVELKLSIPNLEKIEIPSEQKLSLRAPPVA